jgi:hypothetical protein
MRGPPLSIRHLLRRVATAHVSEVICSRKLEAYYFVDITQALTPAAWQIVTKSTAINFQALVATIWPGPSFLEEELIQKPFRR